MAKLTKRQQLFVIEYLKDLNGTQAAIRAGYSLKTARAIACENLTKPDILTAIAAKQQKRFEKLDISGERILQETARCAFFDPRKFFNGDGSPKAITELDDDSAAALAGMDVEDIWEQEERARVQIGVVRKFKLANKLTALDMLGKHQRLWGESSGNGSSGVQITVVNIGNRNQVPAEAANFLVSVGPNGSH